MSGAARTLHRFAGGLTLAGGRETAGRPARRLPLPSRLVLALDRHVGLAAQPTVTPGTRVSKGQRIADKAGYVSAAIHAPTSGTITGEIDVPRPGRGTGRALVLEPDGLDRWGARPAPADWRTLATAELIERIDAAGLVGLGGAGFPSTVKLGEGRSNRVRLFVVNAVECEPTLTCDTRLIIERTQDVVTGAAMLAHLLGAEATVIAVEDDMPEATAALAAALSEARAAAELVVVPVRYPAGGERQLITTLTGREVAPEQLPIHHGVVVHNVATVAAAARAVRDSEPLIERYVTVNGDLSAPGNLIAPIGTPVADLIDACGRRHGRYASVRFGGPLTGFDVDDEQVSIDKRTACIAVAADAPVSAPRPCIRCGECIPVCPSRLQPPALLERVRARDFDVAQDFDLFACIECGLCDVVCPSEIPLMHTFRAGKREIERMDGLEARADLARGQVAERHANDARRAELNAERRAAGRHRKAPAGGPATSDPQADMRAEIDAAVARARARRRERDGAPDS